MNTIFDIVIDRRQTSSVKWNGQNKYLSPAEAEADPIPMWVADMDFRPPVEVTDALQRAVQDTVFGYPLRTESYTEAVCRWQKIRHGWGVNPEWILQTPGVVNGLVNILRSFSQPADDILVQSPCYPAFYSVIRNNGRRAVEAPLVLEKNHYRFDADVFEAAITPNTKIFILCNPHNPTGNVWSRDDLSAMGEICIRKGVLVLSDEVHQDIVVDPNSKHVPFASINEDFANHSITCTAPSKTFNLAGLQCSNIFVPNSRLRQDLNNTLSRAGILFINTLGAVACEAAYRHGETWLDSLLDYITANHRHFSEQIHTNFSAISVHQAASTYLAWMDCRELGLPAKELEHFMLAKAGVWFSPGSEFGQGGSGFLRANLGCNRSRIDEAVTRMKMAIS